MDARTQPIAVSRGMDKDRAVLLMMRAYAILTPLFIIHLNDEIAVGGPDLLFFPALFMLFLIRRLWIDLAGAFYLVFVLFALVSVLHVAGADGGVVRVLSVLRVPIIFMPYLVALQARAWTLEDMRRVLRDFVWAGGAAVAAGIVMHQLGIEVKETTQRLWFDGGSIARAAGLTGNTADYGHMTALWYAAPSSTRRASCPAAGCCWPPSRRRWRRGPSRSAPRARRRSTSSSSPSSPSRPWPRACSARAPSSPARR